MKYDAIIIGSGQAGNPLSYRLADIGWKIALVEKGKVGRTCINTACTPTKTMVHRAQIAHYARNAAPAFTHISYNDFQTVDANITQGKNLTTKNRIVPYCIFTDPQLGGVGLTEREARAAGHKLKIGSIPMSHVLCAMQRDVMSGMMKVVVNAANNRILGAAILGSEGGELVHVPYTLILGNLPYTFLKGAVFIHPTLAERFFGLLDSVKPVD